MSWLFTLLGKSSGNQAEVNSSNQLLVNTGTTDVTSGYSTIATEIDAGSVTGSRTMREPTSSIFNRLSTGRDTLMFSDYFNATAQNTALWKTVTTTFTFAFGSSGYNIFNNSAVTTTGAAQLLQSYRSFSMFGSAPLTFEFSEYRAAIPATNQQSEAGLFLAPSGSTPYSPTDGVYFRCTSNGLYGVLNFAGTETVQQLLTGAQILLNDNTSYRIVISHYRVEFWGATSLASPRILLGVMSVPAANGPSFLSMNVPIGFRLWNNGTAGSATQWKVANAVVTQGDVDMGRPWSHQLCGAGLSAYQGQNGRTMGSTANLGFNQVISGVALNTSSGSGSLGGEFAILPTLANGNDGIVCNFANPSGTTTLTGRTLYVTGIRIQGVVTTALTGGPVIYAYSLGFGATSIILGSSDAAASKGARRIALGFETYAVTAAVGVIGQGVSMSFQSPIVTNPGENFAVVAKNLGTVTSAGVIVLYVAIDGYFD